MPQFDNSYANLHMHSCCSDADFRPLHMPRIAKSLGHSAIALTDHETLCGLPEFFAEAEACGIEAISGVEIFGMLDGIKKPVHVTGLDFDPNHPAIVEFTRKITRTRNENTRAKFERALEMGFFKGITWEDVVRLNPHTDWFYYTQVYRALDIMNIIPLSQEEENRKAAFESPEANAIPLYIAPMQDVIKAIRDAGGVAVLAHPNEAIFPRVREMVDMGLNGIEISYPGASEREAKLAIHASVEYNLYCSGGSDHSGPLSSLGGPFVEVVHSGITRNDFEILKNRALG